MRIAVIGCGVMASSLVKGAGVHEFFCYTPSGTRAKALAEAVSGEFVKELSDLKDKKIDLWLIGMKPQSLKEFSEDFRKLSLTNPYIVSMLAATEIEGLKKRLNSQYVSRIMPNTPVAYSRGVTLIAHAAEVISEQVTLLNEFLKNTGSLHIMSEKELELATLVSGCGPAFFYQFTELLAKSISELGLSRELGEILAKETLIGAATLVEKRAKENLSDLVAEVTSAKGVTIEAINRFREKDHYQIYLEALKKAKQRSDEIKGELS